MTAVHVMQNVSSRHIRQDRTFLNPHSVATGIHERKWESLPGCCKGWSQTGHHQQTGCDHFQRSSGNQTAFVQTTGYVLLHFRYSVGIINFVCARHLQRKLMSATCFEEEMCVIFIPILSVFISLTEET